MDFLDELHYIGLSHRTAPVDVRERYAVKDVDLRACLENLAATPEVKEALVVSTCNRTDVLVVGEDRGRALTIVKNRIFRNIDDQHLYAFHGLHAIMHLFRVAGGLDSQVVGESEILAQLKRAIDAARSVTTVQDELLKLSTQALHVGKRVRHETEIGQGSLSVAKVGVDVAARVFGSFDDCRALVVGAGETGLLVARHLASRGATQMTFANRTIATAELAADEFGAEFCGLDALAQEIRRADLVIVCVQVSEYVIDATHFDKRHLAKRDRPQLVIDLSIPRAVDPAIEELHNLLRYDLDDLRPIITNNREARDRASESSGEILVAEMHKFLSLRTYASFSPAIAGLRKRFEAKREQVFDKIADGSADAQKLQLAHELTRQLLDIALDQMKLGARHTRSEKALDREYQRFLDKL